MNAIIYSNLMNVWIGISNVDFSIHLAKKRKGKNLEKFFVYAFLRSLSEHPDYYQHKDYYD
jgi:hypothetical protein